MTDLSDVKGISVEGAWSLTYILGVLYRRRRLLIMMPLFMAVGLTGASFLLSKKFETKVVLELGHYQHNGNTHYVEPLERAVEQLKVQAALAARPILETDETIKLNLKKDLSVFPRSESGLIEMSLISDAGIAEELLSTVLENVRYEHNKVLSVVRLAHENNLKVAQARFEKLDREKQIIGERLKSLSVEKSVLKEQVDQYSVKVSGLLKQEQHPENQDPLYSMMLNDTMSRIQENLSELQIRLLSQIPSKQRQLSDQEAEVRKQIIKAETDMKAERLFLKNIVNTRAVLGPKRSAGPVWPRPLVMGAVGFALGVLTALVTALLAEYWAINRSTIQTGTPV